MGTKKQYDFIAIGDQTTDAFIKLKDAEVRHINHDEQLICMRFADKIPYEEVNVIPAVGNAANAAVSASRLGLKSAFVSNIGDDRNGEDALAVFKEEGVGTEFVKVHKNKKTNYHYVLSFKGERTILIKHEEYKYALPSIGSPKWIYFSSVGDKTLPFHKQIERYLDKHKGVKMAFQPGTFQMNFGKEKLKGIYQRTELFFCNREEAQRILGKSEKDIKKLLDSIHRLGPQIVVITDGKDGAFVKEGKNYWFMPIYPDKKPPLERTGAGDAFSSTFAVALAHGRGVEEALMWAPVNSMSVVQMVGARAGLVSMRELEKYLLRAPKTYRPKKI